MDDDKNHIYGQRIILLDDDHHSTDFFVRQRIKQNDKMEKVYTHKKNSTTSDDDERDFEILWIFLVIFFWIKKKFDLVFQPNTQTSVKINMKQTTKKNQLMEFEFTRMSRILWSEFFIFSTYERKRMASQKIFHFQMAKNSINWE